MRKTWAPLVSLAVLLWAGPLVAADADSKEAKGKFFFQKGDRVLFLGDSITEQYQYSSYIELYLTTRFPRGGKTFLNAGIGGDTATGGAHRFAAHVLAEKPTAVTIDFGMNDGGYGAYYADRAAQYVRNTEAMLQAAQKAHVRVALISPNAVDVRPRPFLRLYLETQKKFYAPLKELAAKYHVPFVDQYAVTRRVLEKATKDGSTNVQPFPDGVHTSGQGGLLMAHTILVGLHAPALVSSADIDAAAGQAKTKHCTVTNVKKEGQGLSFDRKDEALPFPVQKDWTPILPYVDNLKDLNWYGLKVTGLATGRYRLLIGGTDVGSYSAEQLAEGVNLGNLTSGPLHEQGTKVLTALSAKNQTVHGRFRGVVMFQAPDWLADVAAERKPKELAKRMEQINAKQAEVYKLARPRSHHFELKPVK
jgi:lysophospholipase L1-like esterase